MTALSPTGPSRASAPILSPARAGTGRDGLSAALSTVLLVGDYEDDTSDNLREVGYTVVAPRPGEDPLVAFSRINPHVVVAAADAGAHGFELLRQLREARPGRTVPVILVTSGEEREVLTGLRLGADDCVARSVSGVELAARVQAKTARPPVPAHLVSRDLRTGLLAEGTMLAEAGRELDRGLRTAREGGLGIIEIQEMSGLLDRFGGGAATQIATQVTELLGASPRELERIGLDQSGRLLVLLPETTATELDAHLRVLARRIAAHGFALGNEDVVRVTPVTGWAGFADAADGPELLARATTALWAAGDHLDLLPVRWTPFLEVENSSHKADGWVSRTKERLRLPVQFLTTLLVGVGLPFGAYALLGSIGWDASGVAYWVVMAALLVTAGTIWLEGFHALDPQRPPDEPGAPYPSATAVIAAYLPNEAATIRSTVEAFQRLDYPGPLQILVAYNTPEPMAAEDDLHEMARRDPRILPLKVANSTSKAQNVNAAMSHVTGEFVGMFDRAGATRRRPAWRTRTRRHATILDRRRRRRTALRRSSRAPSPSPRPLPRSATPPGAPRSGSSTASSRTCSSSAPARATTRADLVEIAALLDAAARGPEPALESLNAFEMLVAAPDPQPLPRQRPGRGLRRTQADRARRAGARHARAPALRLRRRRRRVRERLPPRGSRRRALARPARRHRRARRQPRRRRRQRRRHRQGRPARVGRSAPRQPAHRARRRRRHAPRRARRGPPCASASAWRRAVVERLGEAPSS